MKTQTGKLHVLLPRYFLLVTFAFMFVFYVTATDVIRTGEAFEIMDKKQFSASPTYLLADPEKWGGTGISMSVRAEGATIEFDCAEAEITEGFSTSDGSTFALDGTYLRRAPGALRPGFKPEPVPARFEGEISDDEMTLKISYRESFESIGDFTLERGSEGKIRRCL